MLRQQTSDQNVTVTRSTVPRRARYLLYQRDARAGIAFPP